MENRNPVNGQRKNKNDNKNWRTSRKKQKLISTEDNENKQGSQKQQSKSGKNVISIPYFHFTRLKSLNSRNSDDIMTTLAQKEADFESFMCGEMKSDVLVLTLRILVKVCQANFTELVTRILSQACSTNFLKTLENYLKNLPFEIDLEKTSNNFYHSDINRFWSDLTEFLKKIVELTPRLACDKLMPILQKILDIIAMIESNRKYKIDDNIKNITSNILKDLKEKTDILKEKDENNRLMSAEDEEVEKNPPEDFRSLSVIPAVQDLFVEKPFLRPCKIKDAYDSIEHYLDIQFRLLREDFVKPLRNGIKEYSEGNKKSRNSDFRIYKNAKLIPFENKENNVGIKLFFGNLKFVNWRHSKRLIYGALLLLSKDNFKSVLFVKVSNRVEKELEKGYITIEPCEDTTITPEMYNATYVLLESKIYFEPYFQVLTAMKKIYAADFPMETYFIKAEVSTNLPYYLRNQPILTFKKYLNLPVENHTIWPSSHQMEMDESQYNAFKSALTQEFAIIQGPPGTGKTFLALEIVRTLLENKEYWKSYGPIVVVCLTNHALDQFLEGILSQQCTKSVVRVGSRSKSEILKQYSLMERRKVSTNNGHLNFLLFRTKRELEDILNKMQKLRTYIKYLKTPNVIVPLECLQLCPTDDHRLSTFKTNADLLEWVIGTDVSSLLVEPVKIEEKDNFSEDNDLEIDENMCTDDDLLLNFSKLNIDSNNLVNLLDIIDENLNTFNEYLQNLRFTKPLDFQLSISEDHIFKLLKLRKSMDNEFKRHPILYPTSVPSSNPRWESYWQWIKYSYDYISRLLFQLEVDFRQKNAQLKDIKQLADTAVMKEHEIIGLTTTCAAKIQSSLRSLKAPIVLVEEAAEILEAHVVCSITKDCQHVILIGDHKQLRPKASVYELGVKYNLNVSLFERMVNIRGKCMQLEYQHRMRPEIAKLITPSIYETLYNHEVVQDYPNVKGLENNVFFLNHSHNEESYNNEESYKNVHEAKFLLAFAKHLLFQGYKPSEISILCTYTGQLFTFMNEVSGHELLKQVRITTVDNYQGEENKIILLSLVRNNGEGNVGFLREENRVCVALSRAKEGLYIMGNIYDLLEKNKIWPKIKKVLEEDNAIGDSLKLRCQIHADQYIEVRSAKDFKQCPEGGCSKKCDLPLPCGHTCSSVCHILDREHKEFLCKKSCLKSCPVDHPCPLMCWQECQPCLVKVDQLMPCGHTIKIPCSVDPSSFPCPVEVEVKLPDCKHIMKKVCFLPVEKCKCTHNCEIRLPMCGHTCTGICHVRTDPDHLEYICTKNCVRKNIDCSQDHTCRKICYEKCEPCAELIGKKRSCGHYYPKIQCSVKIEDIYCNRKCKRIMNCGHLCKLKCSDECKNCPEKVSKKSSCGHTVTVKCCEEASPSKCSGKCPKLLPCGHPCTKKCKEPCTSDCRALVQLNQPGLCGHILSVPCFLRQSDTKSRELLKYCKKPCEFTLACQHKCQGNCGECLQGRMHASCKEPCRNVFICGHNCEIRCNQECLPCTRKCELQCVHNKCIQDCGQACTPCQEKCDNKCEHRRCSKRCHELCDIEPCNEPCQRELKCGHPCVGFCGEPCPPLCRICDKEELTETLFVNDLNDDTRFVLMTDCNHCIENEELLKWIKLSTEPNESVEIKTPTCPKCKTPIKSSMRIMNQIKNNLKDLMAIKEKEFSKDRIDIKEKQFAYLEIIKTEINKPILQDFPELQRYFRLLQILGSPVRNKRQQYLSAIKIDAFKNIMDVIIRIVSMLTTLQKSHKVIKDQVKILVNFLPNELQISKQRLEDTELEIRRLHLLIEVFNKFSIFGISNTTNEYNILTEIPEVKLLINKLWNIERFTQDVEESILSVINRYSPEKIKIMERNMVVEAIGLSQRHWYKCRNGHFFAIGNCGAPNQTGRCPDCRVNIGGGAQNFPAGLKL